MSDIRGAVTRLRRDGATRVALIGASQGASEVLIAATLPPPGVTGVVALSADELTIPLASAPYPATAVAAAPRLRLPVLVAVAQSDPEVSVPATRRLLTRTGSGRKSLVVLGAQAGHGWDMVTPPPGRRSVPEVQPDRLGVPARPDVMTIMRRVAAALAGLALVTGCGASRQDTGGAAVPTVSASTGSATTGSPAATPAAELEQLLRAGPGPGRVRARRRRRETHPRRHRLRLAAGAAIQRERRRPVFVAAVRGQAGGCRVPRRGLGLRRQSAGRRDRRTGAQAARGRRPAGRADGRLRGREGLTHRRIGGRARRSRASYRCRPRPFFLPASWSWLYARLRCPLLLVTASQDPYGSAQAAQQFLPAARSQRKELVRVPGAAHGTALLAGRAATATVPAILAFLRGVLK